MSATSFEHPDLRRPARGSAAVLRTPAMDSDEVVSYVLERRADSLGGYRAEAAHDRLHRQAQDVPKPRRLRRASTRAWREGGIVDDDGLPCGCSIKLIRDKNGFGQPGSCRSCPDEARTFGMDSFFRALSASTRRTASNTTPVDEGDAALRTARRQTARCSQEGITEAGVDLVVHRRRHRAHEPISTRCRWCRSTSFYSMFGFQRIGDLRRGPFGDSGRPRLPDRARPPVARRSTARACSTRRSLADRGVVGAELAELPTRPSHSSSPSSCARASAACTKSRKTSSTT